MHTISYYTPQVKQACEYCWQMKTCTRGSGSKHNSQMIGINGSLTYFENGFKRYLKECCLMSYYVGSDNLSNYMVNQKFGSIVKPKVPKYCITDNDAFLVYEFNYKDREVIINPEAMNNSDKLEIQRYLNMNEYTESYDIVTKTVYDKTIKERQQMDIDTEYQSVDKPQYVYLIQERTAVVANQPIYKIGRTEQPNFERFKGYGKGYKVLLHILCENCKVTEKMIMDQFKSKYRHATEYGNEYFEGDYKTMICNIASIVIG